MKQTVNRRDFIVKSSLSGITCCGLMIQSDRMGASIVQALRTHASFLRVQRAQKAEERAAKLPVKILFPLLLFIFPAIFVVVLGPAVIQMSKSSFFGGQ